METPPSPPLSVPLMRRLLSGSSNRSTPQNLSQLEPSIVLDIKKGKTKEVLLPLSEINVNVKDPESGDSALHLSITYHKNKITDKLLKVKSLDVNAINFKGQTPVHVAILNRNIYALNRLLKIRPEVKPEICDCNGNNLLHYAAMKSLSLNDIKKIVSQLEKRKTDLSALVVCQNSTGNTPLHQSTEHGSIDMTKLFLHFNKDLCRCRNNSGETPLDIALKVGKDSLTAMLLSESTHDLYPPDLLRHVVDGNMPQLLEQLLALSEETKGERKVMGYPLSPVAVRFIIENLHSYNQRDAEGLSIIHRCIIKGKAEILRVFLTRPDIDLTILDLDGNTPLHLALDPEYYSPDILNLILSWLSMRKGFSDGTRPVPKHLKSEQMPLWSVLLSAVVNKQNAKGFSPLLCLFSCASGMGEKIALQYITQLITLGSDVTLFDKKGNTPLFYAAINGNVSAVEILRVAGASSSVTNHDGLTPVDIALGKEDEELINALVTDVGLLQRNSKKTS